MNHSLRHNVGLTLIEVLIALAILSIALTAIIKVTAQGIQDTIYLQNKMIANWIGVRVINEVRCGMLRLPEAPASITQESITLNQAFVWQAFLALTPNPRIKEINVEVKLKNESSQLIHLTGYVYAAR